MDTRICKECNQEVALIKFQYKTKMLENGEQKRYYKKVCQHCHNRKTALKKKYNSTQQYYEELYNQQEGKCAICKVENNPNSPRGHFDMDHCHETGKIRGLLCNKCNKAIGLFKDNLEALKRAIVYLEKNK